MIQLLPKCAYNAGYGGATSHIGVLGGVGDFGSSTTFGANYAKTPVALDSTFRNLTVLANQPFPVDVTVTLLVDGVASAQVVSLPAGETTAVCIGADVVVTAGQDITYKYQGSNPSGDDLAFCLEREGDGNIYGVTPASGSLLINTGWYGGAFNNGGFQTYTPGVTTFESNTYSLTAANGTITTLMLRAYSGAPGAGTWTGWIRVGQVLQDGSGGTVDTSVTMTGSTTVATSTFSLPVTLGQRVDVVIVRSDLAAPFALAHVAAGIGFEPDTANVFMMVGGSNDTISNTATGWKWTLSAQLVTPEARNAAPISASGFTVLGLAIERDTAPGADRSYIHTIRRSEADTPATVTLANLEDSGVIDGLDVSFVSGQTIDLQSVPVASGATPPVTSRLYWGLAARVGPTPTPEPIPPGVTTVTLTTRRLRRASHLTDEHRWLTYDRFQVDLQAGVGLTDGQGDDPQVMVRWSNDGGHTWSNEHWTTAGRQGARKTRVIVRQTGRARVRTFEIVVSDPVAWFLAAAYLDVTPGNGT